MPSALPVAAEVATAAIALAGLVLVFLGAISASFDSFEQQEKKSVREKFRGRAWLAFVGFALALASAALGLLGKWLLLECAALGGVVLLFLSLFWVLFVAVRAVLEIK